jgi:hypothetical protein
MSLGGDRRMNYKCCNRQKVMTGNSKVIALDGRHGEGEV